MRTTEKNFGCLEINGGLKIGLLYQKYTNFSPQNCRHQKGDMKQASYWRPTNVWSCCTKFSCQSDLVPRIFATLYDTLFFAEIWSGKN